MSRRTPSPSRAAERLRRAEENRELFRAAAAAEGAEREELIDRVTVLNLDVARSVARRFIGRGQAFDDLEQVARLALLNAARAFDPRRGAEFLQYAVPCMRGEIMHSFRDETWVIRPARSVQNRHLAHRAASDEDLVVQGVHITSCYQPLSLDVVPTHGHRAWRDTLPDDGRELERAEVRAWLAPALAALPPRVRRLLHLRFVEGWTQEQIGEELGVSQMHVSRLLRRHLDALRDELAPST